jgi:hypothetical protein
LQTYKKEGRIGKKKNRERKTKVINAIFLANITPVQSYNANLSSIISGAEIKTLKNITNMEPITLKQNDHPSYPQEEVKIIMQDANQNTGETNRGQQQYIKDLGTDFLKELFEKMGQGKNNQAQNQNPNIGQIQTMNNPQNQIIMNTPSQGNMNNMGTFNGLSHMNNMGNFIQLPNNQTAFISGPGPMQSGFFNPTPGNIINTQAMINNQQNTINVS